MDSPCNSYNNSASYCSMNWSDETDAVTCGGIFSGEKLTNSYSCSGNIHSAFDKDPKFDKVLKIKSSCSNNCSTDILAIHTYNQNNGNKLAIYNDTNFTINTVYLMSKDHNYCQQAGSIESQQVVVSTWQGTDSNYLWGSFNTISSNC